MALVHLLDTLNVLIMTNLPHPDEVLPPTPLQHMARTSRFHAYIFIAAGVVALVTRAFDFLRVDRDVVWVTLIFALLWAISEVAYLRVSIPAFSASDDERSQARGEGFWNLGLYVGSIVLSITALLV